MADEHEGPRRAKPAQPAMPPFRGPLGVPARSSQNNGATPESRKAPPFLGARPVGGRGRAGSELPHDAPVAHVEPVERPTANAHPGTTAEREAPSSATDLPWLDTSADAGAQPVLSTDAIPFPPFEHAVPDDAAPAETAQALAGLPYFDGDGDQHERGDQRPVRASGKMHRIEFDLASVLDRLADRVRTGSLAVPDVDPLAGEAAALAAVLAALLRHRG